MKQNRQASPDEVYFFGEGICPGVLEAGVTLSLDEDTELTLGMEGRGENRLGI